MSTSDIYEAERRLEDAEGYYNGAKTGRTGSLKSCVYALMKCVKALLIHIKEQES